MKVTIVSGPPASGKSTITKQLAKDYAAIVLNRDTEGGTIASLLPKLEGLLQNKTHRIVLDNLFPTVEVRKPFIEMAKRYNYEVDCVVMGTSIEDCTFNFVQRAIGILGKFPLPEDIKKAKHPNIFPPAVLFKYKKEFQIITSKVKINI